MHWRCVLDDAVVNAVAYLLSRKDLDRAANVRAALCVT